MDYTAEDLEDLAAMRERRLRLRAIADAKIAECQAMLPAKNWLDMNRQIRAIMAVDRLVVALWSPPPRRRTGRRKQALSPTKSAQEKLLAAHPAPESAPPEAVPEPKPEPTPEPVPDESLAEAVPEAFAVLNEMTRRSAHWVTMWPDGAPFADDEPEGHNHALTEGLLMPSDPAVDVEAWLSREILARANACARQFGRTTGLRVDMKPYSESEPDEWSLSANFGIADHPAEGEQPGLPGLPWWIVRPPPS